VSHGAGLPAGAAPPTTGLLGAAVARLNQVLLVASMASLLGAAGVLTSSVVTRYLFKVPTDWQDEASVFLMVFATFACGAYVQSYRGHVGIAALSSVLPPRLERVRLALADLISFGFCAFFSWKSWSMLKEAVDDHQTTSSSWGPPLWIPYGAMALGMTLLTLQLALQVAGHLRGGAPTR
jgi:TRAP-type C4-dicarboxylate transport system permease small subunit